MGLALGSTTFLTFGTLKHPNEGHLHTIYIFSALHENFDLVLFSFYIVLLCMASKVKGQPPLRLNIESRDEILKCGLVTVHLRQVQTNYSVHPWYPYTFLSLSPQESESTFKKFKYGYYFFNELYLWNQTVEMAKNMKEIKVRSLH